MIRSLARQSTLFARILFWVFLASTAVDAANLDDLLPGVTVLHDDQDGLAGVELALTAGGDHQLPVLPVPAVPHRPDHHQNRDVPATPVRVIFDQDSPSLAADFGRVLLDTYVLASDDPLLRDSLSVPCEALHLRLCTLLI